MFRCTVLSIAVPLSDAPIGRKDGTAKVDMSGRRRTRTTESPNRIEQPPSVVCIGISGIDILRVEAAFPFSIQGIYSLYVT